MTKASGVSESRESRSLGSLGSLGVSNCKLYYSLNIFPYLQSRTRINLLAFEKFPGVSYLLSGHLLGRIFWMTAVLASATGNWL